MIATVFVSWGIWVARCPADGCPGAEHFGADRATGIVGGLTRVDFSCSHCGLVCEAEWPRPEFASDAVRLLAMRPVPATRSWIPGESPHDLLAENITHGLIDTAELNPGGHDVGAIPLMTDGLMVPWLRELVTEKAAQIAADEFARGTLQAGRLAEIGA